MAKAFILVGHSNWGKSKTLKALTGGKIQFRYYRIGEKEFVIKRMSNDEFSDKLKNFCESLNPKESKYVLLALCPDFDDSQKYTEAILACLKSKYELFFFVLRHKYNSNTCIADHEIDKLKGHGVVLVYDEKSEAKERADALKKYIQLHVV